MEKIELKIGNSQIKLSCDDSKKLLHLAKLLNEKINKIKEHKNTSDLKSLLINSLIIMDENEMLKEQIKALESNQQQQSQNEITQLKNNYKIISRNIYELADKLK